MTREEAKKILIRFRADRPDAHDPEFAEALRLAATDSELRQWFALQQEFHGAVRTQLKSMEVPAALKAQILAAKPSVQSARIIPFQREVLAIAATLALMAVGASFWLKAPSEERSFANFRARMTSFALRTYQMDILTPDGAAVRKHLLAHGAPADFPLTPGIAKLPVKGGGRLSWQSHPVAMICFELPSKETLYLFVIDQQSVPDHSIIRATVNPSEILASASWKKDGRVYLIAANTDGQTLAALASPRP